MESVGLAAAEGGFEAGWVVAVAIMVVCSATTVVGFVCQKKAVHGPARWAFGDMVFTPLWLVGFVLAVVVPAPCQVLAYSLAPMSLTSPLSGISVAMNLAVAPRLLGEGRQRWPDLPATALITAGTILTTIFGSHTELDYSFEEMEELFEAPTFLVSLACLVCATAASVTYMSLRRTDIELSAMTRPTNPKICHVFLPAFAAASTGCIANIFLKVVGELFATHGEMWQIAACLPFLATLGGAQLNYLNRGLRLYMQTVFFPIYSALLMLSNTVFGMIFFREYEALLDQGRWIGFAAGTALVVTGIVMFTLRRAEAKPRAPLSPNASSTTASSFNSPNADLWEPLCAQEKAEQPVLYESSISVV